MGQQVLRAFTAASLAAATVLTGGPALAQAPNEPSTTVEQAIARTVADAMPRTQYAWSLNWSAFGVRGGRDVFWHLADPKPYHPVPLPDGVHQRTGWLSVGGRSGGVTVCGDEDRVGLLSIDIADLWLGQSDVISELSALGVAATPITPRGLNLQPAPEDLEDVHPSYTALINRHPASRAWRLEKTGLEPVELTADYRCTPPGTRHATHCKMIWSVLFRPDEREAGSAPCLPPGRPTDS